MEREKKLEIGIVVTLLLSIYFSVLMGNYGNENLKLKEDISKQQIENDSLRDELFNLSTECGRYELTLEHLKEIDSVRGKECINFLEHETE